MEDSEQYEILEATYEVVSFLGLMMNDATSK